MREFDIVIIGGGPGGYVAAIRGAQLGARVALVEKDRLGGTCLNRGCIPTKALYYSAAALNSARHATAFGVDVGTVGFNLARAVERKEQVVEKLVGGVAQLLKGNNVEVINGTGSIEAPGRVRVVTGKDASEEIGAKNIIIATGSEPARIPAFNIDGEAVLTTTEMLRLRKVPESLMVIGGGVNGSEFATMFSTFGSRVMIVEMLPTILATEDRAVSRVILKKFKDNGVSVLTDVAVDGIKAEGGKVKTTLKDGREFITEKALVSIGRSLNSAGLGLDAVGVKTTERGAIEVNDRMETNVKGVYAIGDVTGKVLLAHVASAQGIVAVTNALGKSAEMDYSAVPGGIFTDPEIASVGLREKDAAERGIEVSVGRFPYAASGKAVGMGETEGFVQIIADPGTDKVLGATIIGAHATDMIGEVALAVRTGATAKDIAETIHAHPTLPEMVMEAAEDVHGMAIHKIGRKRR